MAVQAPGRDAPGGRQVSLRTGRQLGDIIFSNLTLSAGGVLIGIILALIVVLTAFSWPAISTLGIGFLTDTEWNPPFNQYGALPYIWGTIYTSLIALVIAVPISLGAALFVVEYAPDWLKSPVSFMVEMLAAIPSIIYGLWALFIMAPFARDFIERPLKAALQDVPVLQVFVERPPIGRDFLMAGIVLAVMITPTIMSIAREVIAAVPDHQREGMLGLGATKAEVISNAVLPYAKAGLFGASILGLARALGETMAVTLLIGGTSRDISLSLFTPGFTLASGIANQFGEAADPLNVGAIVGLALVLMLVATSVNIVARLLLWSMQRGNPAQVRA